MARTVMTLADGAEVVVVALGDGRLGFAPGPAHLPADGAAVTLAAGVHRVTGSTRLVRSGPAYEEVRARIRADAGWWARLRLRRDRPVVLLTPTAAGSSSEAGSPPGSD